MSLFAPNFSQAELTRSDKARQLNLNNAPVGATLSRLQKLSWALQKTRDLLAEKEGRVIALGINSAYRSEAVNRAVGGARFSRHKEGDAADINILGWPPAQVQALVRAAIQAGFRGIGLGTNKAGVASFLHVDLRSAPTVWLYNGGRIGTWRTILGNDPTAKVRAMMD